MADREIAAMLDQLFRQAQMQFGSAIKSRWFHQEDDCPGCGREIDAMKFQGRSALSLNAFIYREHGVLIGYMLCGKCAKYIFKKAKKNPTAQTPLHDKIEQNLKQAFVKHLGH